jgi:hypothetical protein
VAGRKKRRKPHDDPEGKNMKISRKSWILLVSLAFLFIFSQFEMEEAHAWWNANYQYRKQITVTNNDSVQLAANTTVGFTTDTATLISNSKLRSDGKDWRIIRDNAGTETEIAQLVEGGWNSSSTETWFRLQAAINAGSNDSNYYVYYGYSSESTSPSSFTTSEAIQEQYTTCDNQTAEAVDYNGTEWGGAQGVQFNAGTSRYWKITKFEFYLNNGPRSSSQVAGFIFTSTGSLEGNEVTNGKSTAVASNTLSGWAPLSWGSAKPKVKTGTQYYIAVLPTTPANRNAVGGSGYFRWDFDGPTGGYRSGTSACKVLGTSLIFPMERTVLLRSTAGKPPTATCPLPSVPSSHLQTPALPRQTP